MGGDVLSQAEVENLLSALEGEPEERGCGPRLAQLAQSSAESARVSY